MSHKVGFYETRSGKKPVISFLVKLSKRDRKCYEKIRMTIELLDEYGLDNDFDKNQTEYVIKKLRTELWEVKKDEVRILFTLSEDKILLLVHSFIKKSQKTPQKDIDVALKRIAEYKGRKNEEKM